MGIPALIIGIVIGVISGAWVVLGVCLLAPLVIVGSIVAFMVSLSFPPLRPWGIAFLMFSVGLLIGFLINSLVTVAIFGLVMAVIL